MSKIVEVVYENGVLRPLQPLGLKERQTLRIEVLADEQMSGKSENELEDLVERLIAAGLMSSRHKSSVVPPDPLGAEARKRLADRVGHAPGKSTSEMVIEDRGER